MKVVLLIFLGAATLHLADRSIALRVCSDPDNLPYSNDRLEGFENRLAEIVAREMGARLQYTWWPQRRGFLRNTLNAGRCDVVIGLPSAVDLGLTTRPYYRSTYVFVSRSDRALDDIDSFEDGRLRNLQIGVQLVGDDGANPPPAHALSRRGMTANVVGFPVYDDPSRIVRAVAEGAIDIAVVWGPLAGYYAAREDEQLAVTPLGVQEDSPSLPLAFDMSMAVRRGDDDRLKRLDEILTLRREEIASVLSSFHVPVVGPVGEGSPAQW